MRTVYYASKGDTRMGHGGRDFLPHRLRAVRFLERIRDVSTFLAFCRRPGRGVWKYRAQRGTRFAVTAATAQPRPLTLPPRDKIHQSGRTRSLNEHT